ncbi:hypothetical protein [Mesoterricola silvestris]|uniref:Uncharacterized protein n=1 Tax=Mesoterricola silvestris TaxID=2927979 RepID=A0AA48GS97_9BACT|nr:hypothetical protein [Mesoterricola silvestris]BDU73067.1 hypothetical protein METEAL_22410 [Mesoterricola silvestris]
MTSVNSINNSTYLDKLLAAQTTDAPEGAAKANNAFADLFQSILDGTAQAESAPAAPGAGSAASDMNSLGQALASGNLSAAQLAFQSLQTHLDGPRGAHPPHPAPDAAQTSAAVPSTTPADLLNLLMGKS